MLQAEGYAGFNGLYETGRIAEAACWSQVRRKIRDIYVAGCSPIAQEALARIAAVYAIDASIGLLVREASVYSVDTGYGERRCRA